MLFFLIHHLVPDIFVIASNQLQADHCTAIAVGCGALSEGRCGAGQSDDAEGNDDFRVIQVPAKNFTQGSLRPVYDDNNDFPRFVNPEKALGYGEPGKPRTSPIGYIPEVPHTYAYFDGGYGLQNEHGLSIGESTAGARLFTKPIHKGGAALFCINELSRIALERCKTVRCAVEEIGRLAVEHGFYGAANALGGEALVLADSTEAWVFHILADDTSRSAVWAAQRVPDGEVAVVANHFIIREMDFQDTANFLASPTIREVAERLGWWKRGETFDFTKVFGGGEYSSPYYSSRRVWRVYKMINPQFWMSPDVPYTVDHATLPFSLRPAKPLEMSDIFAIYRDHYEGTDLDLTKGPAAGPFGSPVRWDTPGTTVGNDHRCAWERAIGMYRTMYVTFGVSTWKQSSNSTTPVLWFAVGRPDTSLFMPLRHEFGSPRILSTGKNMEIDDESFFWAQQKLGPLLDIKFQPVVNDLRAVQMEWEQKGERLVDDGKDLLEFARNARVRWHDLYEEILVKYQDGYVLDKTNMTVTAVGYPKKWLKFVDYENDVCASSKEIKNQQETLDHAQKLGQHVFYLQNITAV